jgi:hypothetical protein
MTEPLFGLTSSRPDAELHSCDLCPAAAMASRDTLRVHGWIVFDGESVTGKPLHVRICRACRLKENR